MLKFKHYYFFLFIISAFVSFGFAASTALAVSGGNGDIVVRGSVKTPTFPDKKWNYWIEKSLFGEQTMFITTHYNSILKMENPQDGNNERIWWFIESIQHQPGGAWYPHTRGRLTIKNNPNDAQGHIGELRRTDYYYQGEWLNIAPNLLGQQPQFRGMTLYLHTESRAN